MIELNTLYSMMFEKLNDQLTDNIPRWVDPDDKKRWVHTQISRLLDKLLSDVVIPKTEEEMYDSM